VERKERKERKEERKKEGRKERKKEKHLLFSDREVERAKPPVGAREHGINGRYKGRC
jgi:hypothetical protein